MSQWKNLADALLTNHLRLISSSVIRHIDISSVQLLSSVRFFATPWTAAHQASLSITNSWSLLKFMSIKLVMPSNHLILCHLLLLLPSVFPSIKVFSNESVLCIRWPKCWSFSFSISPSNEYSGLISFRIDWLDLLAVDTPCSWYCHHVPLIWWIQCSLVIFWPKLCKLNLIKSTLKLTDFLQDLLTNILKALSSSKTRKGWGTLTDWRMLRNRTTKCMVVSWIGPWNRRRTLVNKWVIF